MRITLRTRTRQVHAGRVVVLSGTAGPARNGATVKLQQRVRTRSGKLIFRNLKLVRLRRHTQERSRFLFRVRVRRSTTFRVLVPGNADYLPSTSTPLRVKVRH